MKPEDYIKLPSDRKPYENKPVTVFRKEVMYDINALPDFVISENYEIILKAVSDHYTKTGILVYDASKGKAPIFADKDLKR